MKSVNLKNLVAKKIGKLIKTKKHKSQPKLTTLQQWASVKTISSRPKEESEYSVDGGLKRNITVNTI